MLVPYLCTVLTNVAAHLGHTEEGLQALAEAHTLVEQQEECWWEAEIHRLRGVLLLRQPGTPQAEAEEMLAIQKEIQNGDYPKLISNFPKLIISII